MLPLLRHRSSAIRYIKFIFTIVFSLSLTSFAAAEGNNPEYHKAVLDNGAAIVSRHVPDSPLVTIQIEVLSGLSNEGEYAGSGVSHFLEHILFKGTHDKTSDEIFKEIRQMGGMTNAATGMDSAEYYITVPNENFEKAMVLLTDMVMDPVFSDEDMTKERDVILKEMKLHNDNPRSRLIRELFSQAYIEHTYKYPVIGYIDRFKTLTRENIIKYHKDAYAPDRIVMGIAGGVPPEEALAAAKKKLEEYKRGKAWFAPISREPRQLDEREVRFSMDVSLGYLAMGFHSTSLFSEDLYSLDVLCILLGGGRGSRLYERLVRDTELLYAVSCSSLTPRYPGLFIITGVGEPDKLEEAKKEIFSVIRELKIGKIRNDEIERARNIVSSGYLHSNEQIDGIVSSMTESQLFTGDPFFYEKYVEEIKEVSKKEVENAIFRYLDMDNSTTVSLLPEDFTGAQKETEERGEIKGEEEEEGEEEKEEKSVTLENGLKVVVKKRERLPLVSLAIAFPGGVTAESAEHNGLSNLTASLILKGTKKRREEKIVPVIESMGGSISAFSGKNSLGVTMSLLSKDLEKGLEIFQDVIRNPVFPSEEIEKQKEKIIASIREQEKVMFTQGMIQLRKLIYKDHPYAMRAEGEIKTVEKLSGEEVIAFYARHFSPKGAVLTVVGDVDIEETVERMSNIFESWESAGYKAEEKEVKPLTRPAQKEFAMRKEESLLLIGFQGVDINDDRKYALSMIGTMLSGGGGILFKAVREDEGLAYSCGALSMAFVDQGYFVMYVKTTEDDLPKAEKAIFDIIKKIQKGGFPQEDIESARNKMLTMYASSLEANSSLAMIMVLDELYGLGFDDYKKYPAKIKSVTREEVIACAKEFLNPDRHAKIIIHSKLGDTPGVSPRSELTPGVSPLRKVR